MRDLAAHQKLESINGAGIAREADEAFIDDFGARFGGYVAAQIDIELACDLQIICGPGITHGIMQSNAAASRYCYEWIRVSRVAV
jgi:hypothetical protein